MIKYFLTSVFLGSVLCLCAQSIPTPSEFLPYEHGKKFTPHHLLIDYYEHVASLSPMVQLESYGSTNEDRPLMIAMVSTPENLAKADQYVSANRNNIWQNGDAMSIADQKAIVWLSFSVHGNEAAGSESAMPVLYNLITKPECQAWLENTIVILDPSINPDGYSRYTHWNRRMSNTIPQKDQNSIEHHEPWPGGRTNHYFHDLNRDWAWLTQKESQQRINIFRKWMPHIHADLHEMGFNSPYYFAPAAQPYHEYITQFQRDFQFDIGKNHASHFDKKGWLYYTREVFDLLYPSYGDTYPTYNGSIGMTYEQGGSGYAGLEIELENQDLLKLEHRIAHHTTTALSTVEIASKNKDRLIDNFKSYFSEATDNPQGKYTSFIIKRGKDDYGLQQLLNLLDKHEILYHSAKPGRINAWNYKTSRNENITTAEEDIVISAYQPLGTLAQILLEPEPGLVDSLTYDITAWSLIYAYGLNAYATTQKIDFDASEINHNNSGTPEFKNKYDADQKIFMVKWHGIDDAKFLSALFKKGIQVRTTPETIRSKGETFDPGTLIISYADNKSFGNTYASTVAEIADNFNIKLYPSASGFFDQGPDIGSSKIQLLKTPKILVLTDDGTSSYSYGEIWNYFEQVIEYPITNVPVENFAGVTLDNYNVIIFPEGWYNAIAESRSDIKSFIRKGGKVIAVGQATRFFGGEDAGFGLSTYVDEGSKKTAQELAEQRRMNARLDHYEDRVRARINNQIPGAITEVTMDASHPLAYGIGDQYYSLKTSDLHLDLQRDAWNVGHLESGFKSYGFIGQNVKTKMPETAVFIHDTIGRGDIIYLTDNPLFRSFWYKGIFLFSNALFQVQ